MTKKELRQQMKQLKGMTPEAVKHVEADMVFNMIEKMPAWQQAQHILCYWSLPDELPTHEMVQRWLEAGKNIYLPRVVGDDLEIVPYHGAQSLDDNNKFHIGEPHVWNLSSCQLLRLTQSAIAWDVARGSMTGC